MWSTSNTYTSDHLGDQDRKSQRKEKARGPGKDKPGIRRNDR